MCHALVRVQYKNVKDSETSACETPDDLERKLSELQSRDQVQRIGVFLCHRHVERIETWQATPYTPPVAKEQPL